MKANIQERENCRKAWGACSPKPRQMIRIAEALLRRKNAGCALKYILRAGIKYILLYIFLTKRGAGGIIL